MKNYIEDYYAHDPIKASKFIEIFDQINKTLPNMSLNVQKYVLQSVDQYFESVIIHESGMLANPLEDLVKLDDTWLKMALMIYDEQFLLKN